MKNERRVFLDFPNLFNVHHYPIWTQTQIFTSFLGDSWLTFLKKSFTNEKELNFPKWLIKTALYFKGKIVLTGNLLERKADIDIVLKISFGLCQIDSSIHDIIWLDWIIRFCRCEMAHNTCLQTLFNYLRLGYFFFWKVEFIKSK